MVAGTPRKRAACATPRPWLPPDAVTTPPASAASGAANSRLHAPRALNEPPTCRCSSLSVTLGSPGSAHSMVGVRRTYGRMRAAAARASSSVGPRSGTVERAADRVVVVRQLQRLVGVRRRHARELLVV